MPVCLSDRFGTQGNMTRWRNFLPNRSEGCIYCRKEALDVDYDTKYNCLEDQEIKYVIDTVWDQIIQKKIATNSHLPYNAPKFRLAGLSYDAGRPILQIGRTSYKEYVAYRTSAHLRRLSRKKASVFSTPVRCFMPNVIGNVAIILTDDMRSIAIRRSRRVSTYARYYDLPGGHPEPLEVAEWSENCSSPNINQSILEELFGSVQREVCEELSLKHEETDAPILIAILENLQDIGTPDMVFVLPVYVTAAELCHRFYKRNPKYAEVAGIRQFDPFEINGIATLCPQTPIMEGAFYVAQSIQRSFRGGL
jgi:hypothetical protein